MYPVIKVKSIDKDAWFNELLETIAGFQCKDSFSSHLGKSSPEQKDVVNGFQSSLYKFLCKKLPDLYWETEHKPSKEQKDSIDIYAECKEFSVVIELDKTRADQVAKKFVSRVALMPNKKAYFLSLCYPGTERMNPTECIKYFGYCSNISKRITNVVYAGLVIEKTK